MARYFILSILTLALVCVTGLPYFDQSPVSLNLLQPYSPYDYYKYFKFQDKVEVRLYYESLCPDCIAEYPELPPLIRKLGSYIDLTTLPYGNAKMRKENGTTVIVCQHGEKECYGNKLHACAIDQLPTTQAYVDYNACLMAQGSNDHAASLCGRLLRVDSESIKKCAKGERGSELLKYYGDESGKVSYNGVPFVLVNGRPKPDEQSLWDAVCGAFVHPPRQCAKM